MSQICKNGKIELELRLRKMMNYKSPSKNSLPIEGIWKIDEEGKYFDYNWLSEFLEIIKVSQNYIFW